MEAPAAAAVVAAVGVGKANSSGADAHHATLLLRYGAGASFEDKVAFLTEQLAALEPVKDWKRTVKSELAKLEYSADHLQSVRSLSSLESPLLYCVLEKMGLVSALKRSVIDLHCAAAQAVQAASAKQAKREEAFLIPEMRSSHGCSLDAVLNVREHWEAITREEMLRFASETGRPLVALASSASATNATGSATSTQAAAADELKMNAVGGPEPTSSKAAKLGTTRFLYDGRDLLHALQAIKPSNRTADATAQAQEAWGSIQLQLYTPPFLEFRRLFSELSPVHGQIGLDELFSSERQTFLAEKNRVGDLVLTHQSVSMARQYAKTGCPVSLRPRVWRQALALYINAETRDYFEELQRRVAQWKYLTDDMYLLDLQQTFDSSDYFVFQDHLESVVMAFTRDSYVQQHALQVNGAVPAPPQQQVEDSEGLEASPIVPPNGVLPFSGLVMYAAPLTYLFNEPVEIYYVFRELYVRYWSKLNAIRTDKSTILGLCKLFEELTVHSSASTVFHLINIGIRPLDIAFPWIQSAFSGVLEIDQVLLLWDRVIGYDSLELIAIFAAALFHFRAEELEAVTSMEGVEEVFAELIEIQVVPILQEFLFLLS